MLLFMLLYMVMQVFKFPLDFTNNPIWFPSKKNNQQGFTLVNFEILAGYTQLEWMPSESSVKRVPLTTVVVNSIIYSVGGALVNAMVTCLMAYLTAKYAYFYSKIIYSIVIIVMVIPIVGAQASEIEVLKSLGLYNTRFGFIVLKASFVGMYFLVFYQTFKSIPMTYSEAAMIDGASDWCIMTKICLPLVLNVFTTVALITFIQYWNDYQMAMLYMPNYPTLSYFLFQVQNVRKQVPVNGLPAPMKSITSGETPTKMAATFVLVTPILLIFIALHKKLMGNLSIGGIKG
jgi:ABC-type glycerol-3-phosphate transport system permease component